MGIFDNSLIKLSVAGVNGQLYIYEDKVVIERKGALGFLSIGLAGSKTIPMNSIMSVQFREGTSLTNGYIQFGILGGKEMTGGLTAATKDENTVIIRKTDNATGMKIKDFIEKKSMDSGQNKTTVVQQASTADEILKFKKLADDGIITQEEFEAKKKQLLGL